MSGPPFGWTWNSGAGVVSGNPNPGAQLASADPTTGALRLVMATDPSAPSAISRITSVGNTVGIPVDSRGQTLDWPSLQMDVAVTYRLDGATLRVSRLFAASRVAARVVVFVEDLDGGGVFDGGVPSIIADNGDVAFSFSGTLPPRFPVGRTAVASGVVPARPHHRYRVWADLRGDVSAAGFGGFGGSAAGADVAVTVTNISALWHLPPP